MALYTVVDNGRLFSEVNGDVLKFNLKQTLFISFFNSRTQQGYAGAFFASKLKNNFQEILKSVTNGTSATPSSLAIKAVGTAEDLKILQKILEENKLTLAGQKSCKAALVEIFFYTRENRLRVAELSNDPITPIADSNSPIKVGIIDDSKTIRTLLKKIFDDDNKIKVIWEASSPSQALQFLKTSKPDVLTLDIHMPEMNGAELLKHYMPNHPIPTVVITSLGKDDGPLVFESLENGAVDYIQKPSAADLNTAKAIIIEKVRAAAQAKIIKKSLHQPKLPVSIGNLDKSYLIAIGSSTGGTEAVKEVLTRLPKDIPPILIVQHIPPVFSLAFANRLNDLCPFEVKEAENGDEVRAGRVLIAQGGTQMRIKKVGDQLKVVVDDSAPVNRHKPSVDVLFNSVAKELKTSAIGVILTGMGADGAQGLLAMKQAGARTVAQDEASCVVFGMPKEAIKLGAADQITSLIDIPQLLLTWLSGKKLAKLHAN